MKHFLNIIDLSNDELNGLLSEAARLKAAHARRIPAHSLKGRVVALIFEKPSLRTRVSFESGVAQLEGTSMYLPGNEVGLGWRETLADFSRTISQYVDMLVLRVYRHETLDGLAAHSTIPIINALSDWSHPCQGLADVLTIRELFGTETGRTVAFVGDGNNVARSLAVACGKLGMRFVLACPIGYGFDDKFLAQYRTRVGENLPVEVNDPTAAVAQADVIYTDVWTSMGQEAEREERLRRFTGFQVNAGLLAKAPPHCKVLHCLPAHRGEEVTDDVMDGPACAAFQQAGNRLHTQKAVMEWLLK
ncbi:ornithine carbamoyltransferase : Ornithine carbamoyltransferase OS=Rhodopirellula sp. SWK7 GN=RRSWK_05436 PE=3 SV=1: OTCace_N: OTCace [Gemmataceae bacterium]|nr:ornithine carbamoyltransferase : Ornithine carbamoyltransferase OS=Rhodopirellula sp. SWK7 GN=RRSWK_05436 PE=3 SV=1: OTCace_N: OTCace [Gemmataceae bacterium]VTT98610.1 ornithine carbamoyltransferase : Ornithine carbamoyltransferase OS=Rhodopirellula sp. SWK7 GN=RRSWK_05436 PE=3 SV=1: OTCace_N: OTCace [Gemmataceae bacterium]